MTKNRPGIGHKIGLEPGPRAHFSRQRPSLPACLQEDPHVTWCGDTEPGPETTPTHKKDGSTGRDTVSNKTREGT